MKNKKIQQTAIAMVVVQIISLSSMHPASLYAGEAGPLLIEGTATPPGKKPGDASTPNAPDSKKTGLESLDFLSGDNPLKKNTGNSEKKVIKNIKDGNVSSELRQFINAGFDPIEPVTEYPKSITLIYKNEKLERSEFTDSEGNLRSTLYSENGDPLSTTVSDKKGKPVKSILFEENKTTITFNKYLNDEYGQIIVYTRKNGETDENPEGYHLRIEYYNVTDALLPVNEDDNPIYLSSALEIESGSADLRDISAIQSFAMVSTDDSKIYGVVYERDKNKNIVPYLDIETAYGAYETRLENLDNLYDIVQNCWNIFFEVDTKIFLSAMIAESTGLSFTAADLHLMTVGANGTDLSYRYKAGNETYFLTFRIIFGEDSVNVVQLFDGKSEQKLNENLALFSSDPEISDLIENGLILAITKNGSGATFLTGEGIIKLDFFPSVKDTVVLKITYPDKSVRKITAKKKRW